MEKDQLAVPYSDEWWFQRLHAEFTNREERMDGKKHSRTQWMDILWKWFIGDPPMLEHMTGWQSQVTRDVLRQGRANYARLAVEAKLDRCKLAGFRTVDVNDDDDEDGDGPEATLRRWMKHARRAFSQALLYASVMKEGYVWVGGVNDRTSVPITTAEDPRNCVGLLDPEDPDVVIAAMKAWTDPLEKVDHLRLVVPTVLDGEPSKTDYQVRAYTRPMSSANVMPLSLEKWELDETLSGPHPISGRGSCVWRIDAPYGLGDFEPFLDLLQRINSGIIDRLWIQKHQVFRQRALQFKEQGGDPADHGLPEEDDEGNEIDYDEIFSADPGALWELPVGAAIWESTPTDLQGPLLAVRDDVKEFAVMSRTPLYSLLPDAVNGSAEGASLAREGIVFKVENWQDDVTPLVLYVAEDAMAALGHEGLELEALWRSAERHSLQQRTDAAVKAKNAGVPQEGIWDDFLAADPETIRRWKMLKARDLLFQIPGQSAGNTSAEQSAVGLQPQQPVTEDDSDGTDPAATA